MECKRGKAHSIYSDEEDVDDDNEEEWMKWRAKSLNNNNGTRSPPLAPARKKPRRESFCTIKSSVQQKNSVKSKPTAHDSVVSPPHVHKRTIIHIDIDCFYAQVEMIVNPSLRVRPLGIQQKRILVTCNYVARERGLKKLMPLSDAKKKCPDIVVVNGEDLTKYREFSSRVTKLLQGFASPVERLGLDENFLDVTELVKTRMGDELKPVGFVYGQQEDSSMKEECACGCHRRLAIGSVLAVEIRRAIFNEIGLTCCAGISHNKLMAKLSGEQNKPNKQTILYPEHVNELMRSLQVRKIPGIGHSAASRLQCLGVTSVSELQACSVQVLQAEFGQQMASTLQRVSHGIDDTDVITTGTPKSISEEDSYQNCSSLDAVQASLQVLIGNLIPRLNGEIGSPQTVRLSIRRGEVDSGTYKKESRQCPIPLKFSLSTEDIIEKTKILFGLTVDLFHKLVDVRKPFKVRVLNVCLTNFQKSSAGDKTTIKTFFQKNQVPISYESCCEKKCPEMKKRCYQNEGNNVISGELPVQSQICTVTTSKVAAGKPTVKAESNLKSNDTESSYSREISLPSTSIVSCSTWPSNEVTVKLNNTNQTYGIVSLPKEVDPTVFAALPVDVQRELQREWRQWGVNSSKGKSKVASKPVGLLKYFSKS